MSSNITKWNKNCHKMAKSLQHSSLFSSFKNSSVSLQQKKTLIHLRSITEFASMWVSLVRGLGSMFGIKETPPPKSTAIVSCWTTKLALRVKSPLFCCFFDKQRCAADFCLGWNVKSGETRKMGFLNGFLWNWISICFQFFSVSIKRREYLQSIPKNVSWYPKRLGLNGCLVKQPFPK